MQQQSRTSPPKCCSCLLVICCCIVLQLFLQVALHFVADEATRQLGAAVRQQLHMHKRCCPSDPLLSSLCCRLRCTLLRTRPRALTWHCSAATSRWRWLLPRRWTTRTPGTSWVGCNNRYCSDALAANNAWTFVSVWLRAGRARLQLALLAACYCIIADQLSRVQPYHSSSKSYVHALLVLPLLLFMSTVAGVEALRRGNFQIGEFSYQSTARKHRI